MTGTLFIIGLLVVALSLYLIKKEVRDSDLSKHLRKMEGNGK